ncbi:hypothetical protein ACFW9N_37215 [Streptomyces sp. NPDC059496]|uniref:hypothetical protein n=1 Tax=Streptomyces sp. NPDC059496 TaxID=3346851 RepID=UPI0036AEAA84
MTIATKATTAGVLAAFVCAGLVTPQAASADSPSSTGVGTLSGQELGVGTLSGQELGVGTLSGQELGAAKAANDDRNDRSKDGWGGRDATAAEIKAKDAYMAANKPKNSTLANSRMLPYVHQGQWYNNYCGPATLVMALGMRGIWNHDQGTFARWIGISPNNGGTGVDQMNKQLNDESGGFTYIRANLPYTPTGADVTLFKNRLMSDTDLGGSLVGNSMEVYNGPHLVGHPNNRSTIYHWFPFQGYDQDWAAYMDSATTVWSSVPARNGMPNSTLVTIMGGRGYNW